MHNSAKKTLIDLFNSIGWEGVVEEAFAEECRNAYLHGLCDSAFDEWECADDFREILAERWECDYTEIELWQLQDEFPDRVFRETREDGLQHYRGRLFSLRDYQIAKQAIAALGNDKFADNYEKRFGKKVRENAHLGEWENELAD